MTAKERQKTLLQVVAKSATMRFVEATRIIPMAVALKKPERGADFGIFDDADAMSALIQQSFKEATLEAIHENDRLGVPSYSAVGGQIVVRQPPKRATLE